MKNRMVTAVKGALVVATLFGSGTAFADILKVNNLGDATGNHLCVPGAVACTLREAMAIADRNPSKSFDIQITKTGAIFLSKPLVLEKGKAKIIGMTGLPAQSIIDGNKKGRVFTVRAASGFRPLLTLKAVTVRNGKGTDTSESSDFSQGGGILVSGSKLVLENAVVRDNTSTGFGAGIALFSGAELVMTNTLVQNNKGTSTNCGGGFFTAAGGLMADNGTRVTIDRSTFDGNSQCRAGAMMVGDATAFVLQNSTISNNTGHTRGGGILFVGGTGTRTHSLRFNTITKNKAALIGGTTGDRAFGGGLAFQDYNNKLVLSGNIIAGNTATNTAPDIKSVTKTPGHDCLTQGNAFTVNAFGNFFGTIGASASTGSSGTVAISGGTQRFSDCFALRTGSFAGTDAKVLDPKLTAVTPANTTSFQTPHFTSTNTVQVRNGFRITSTTSSAHFCPPEDQRTVLRPDDLICDIGSIEH